MSSVCDTLSSDNICLAFQFISTNSSMEWHSTRRDVLLAPQLSRSEFEEFIHTQFCRRHNRDLLRKVISLSGSWVEWHSGARSTGGQ
jgi:hypothetical protein